MFNLISNAGGSKPHHLSDRRFATQGDTFAPPPATPAPAVSLTTPTGEPVTISNATVGTVTVGGDSFVMAGNGVVSAALGAAAGETLTFAGVSQLTLTGPSAGGAADTITANGGTNTFVAGRGAMDITGGSGADTYVFAAGSGPLTIEDFSVANGDRLAIGANLQGSMQTTADGSGGTLLSFAGAGSIDFKSVATLPTGSINFVAIDPGGPPGGVALPPAPSRPTPAAGAQPAPLVTVTTPTGEPVTISNATVGTVTVGGDSFVMAGNGVVSATLGAGAGETLTFAGVSQLTLTGPSAGGAADIITAGGGTNTFIAGAGAMDITGGPGADTYVFAAGSGPLTIEDFSVTNGDRLTIGANLQGSMQTTADGSGGTLLSFAGAGSIDLKSVATLPSSAIGFVAFDPTRP